MIIGVDGGPYSDAAYEQENHNSHVSKVIGFPRQANRRYLPGPKVMGVGTERLAFNVRNLIIDLRKRDLNEKIFLTGHSRGGAAVLRAAQLLWQENTAAEIGQKNYMIDGMFLFDAVNMTSHSEIWRKNIFSKGAVEADFGLGLIYGADYVYNAYNYFAHDADNDTRKIDVDTLPFNIRRCFHAMRDPLAGSWPAWGNCGTTASKPDQLVKKFFYGSHAAVGGTPGTGDLKYKDLVFVDEIGSGPGSKGPYQYQYNQRWADDWDCERKVRKWMWGHLQELGAI